jgi:hypothetical protein
MGPLPARRDHPKQLGIRTSERHAHFDVIRHVKRIVVLWFWHQDMVTDEDSVPAWGVCIRGIYHCRPAKGSGIGFIEIDRSRMLCTLRNPTVCLTTSEWEPNIAMGPVNLVSTLTSNFILEAHLLPIARHRNIANQNPKLHCSDSDCSDRHSNYIQAEVSVGRSRFSVSSKCASWGV